MERNLLAPGECCGCNVVVEYRYDHIWIVAAVFANLIVMMLVVRSIVDRTELTAGWKLFWSLVVFSFPILGCLAWFVAGRKRKVREP